MNLDQTRMPTGFFNGVAYWVQNCNGNTYFQTEGMFSAQFVTSEQLGIQGMLQLKELIKKTIDMLNS